MEGFEQRSDTKLHFKKITECDEGSVRIDCVENRLYGRGARQKQVDQFGCGNDPGRDRGGLDQNGCSGGAEK